MRHCGWLLGLLSLFSLATHASDWQEIKNEAKGQTVWFNAWGGDTAINRYLDWVSGEMKTHYAINLKIVRLADAADAVKRIQTEAAAGRRARLCQRWRGKGMRQPGYRRRAACCGHSSCL